MSRLDALYQITVQLHALLSEDMTVDNRESLLEKVNTLLDQRALEMKQVTPPYTEAEQTRGKDIVRLNKAVEEKMNHLFADLKKEIQHVKKQKQSNYSYINPYGKMTSTDGMYVDSKQ